MHSSTPHSFGENLQITTISKPARTDESIVTLPLSESEITSVEVNYTVVVS